MAKQLTANENPKKQSLPAAPWKIVEPVKKSIYFSMLVSSLSSITSVLSFLFIAFIFKDYLETDVINWYWFFAILLLNIASYSLRHLSSRTASIAAVDLESILRKKIAAKLSKASFGTITEQGSSSLIKVMQDDVSETQTFVAHATPLIIRTYVTPIFTLLVLFAVDWQLALIAIGVLCVGMIMLAWILSRIKKANAIKQYVSAREEVSNSVIEFVQAMPVVRTFDSGQTSFGRYEKALDNYLGVVTKFLKINGMAVRLSLFALNPLPTLVVLLWVGSYWFYSGWLDFATWVAFLLLGTGMAEAFIPYMSLYHIAERSKASIQRVQQILELPELIQREPAQQPVDASVVFENVDFCYDTRTENALTDVSFSVPSGSFTALVGGSGAGKSTVAQLIPRFWDATKGSVKVGNADVRNIPTKVLMEQVAFVFQDSFLFSGTIAENIKLGQDNATDDDIIAAAKSAQAHDFISALPDGYDTEVGERGTRLSGGQKQRITIARAILQNRPILVLDEATAFADVENEALLIKALKQLMQDKTVLMIAHRLQTIADADQILVFKQGRLAEAGSPSELLANQGEYTKLWNAYKQAQNWKIVN